MRMMVMRMVIMIMVVTGSMPVVVLMAMSGLRETGSSSCRSDAIAQVVDLLGDGIAGQFVPMRYRHRSGRYRYRDIIDPWKPPNGRTDLCSTGGAIHTGDAKASLVKRCGH